MMDGYSIDQTREHSENKELSSDEQLGFSLDVMQEKYEKLRELLPEVFTEVIILDKLFEGSDQLKTNTLLQFKDAGVEFRTV